MALHLWSLFQYPLILRSRRLNHHPEFHFNKKIINKNKKEEKWIKSTVKVNVVKIHWKFGGDENGGMEI